MKTLKLVNGDLSFDESKELEMVSDDEEYVQNLETILQTNLGEFELDETIGLDRGNIMTKGFDEEQARTAIVEATMQEDRTEEITDISFIMDKTKRSLSVDLEAKETNGSSVNLAGVDLNA